ncbi:MAG: lysophospholipid acyltransferase family protein [Candidatus Omnitrophota bacterium]
MFRLKVEGLQNFPAAGKIIIAANHSSYLDSMAIISAIPRRIKWLIQKGIYDLWWLKWFFFLTGMIPENGAVGKSLLFLEEGRTIGMFPEGTRSQDGKLHYGRKGAAILALKTGAIVVPCAVRGAFEAYPRNALFPKPYPVKVLVGEPIVFRKVDNPEETEINSALDKIMSSIKSLMEIK